MKLQQQINPNKSVLLLLLFFNPNFNPSPAACPVTHLLITIRERAKGTATGSLERQLRQLGCSVLKQIGFLPSPRLPIGSLPSWISFLDWLAPGEWRTECSMLGTEPEDWYFALSLSPLLSLTLSFNLKFWLCLNI
jgi:hypothetical protein